MGCTASAEQSTSQARLPISKLTLLGGGSQAQKKSAVEHQQCFDGEWCYERVQGACARGTWISGSISDDELTWRDKRRSISKIRVSEVLGFIEVTIRGELCTGELQQNGSKIRWSNGDIWSRLNPVTHLATPGSPARLRRGSSITRH